jgi:uncharacterized protein YjdB
MMETNNFNRWFRKCRLESMVKKIKTRKVLSLILCLTLSINAGFFNYLPSVANAAVAEDPNRELGLNDIPDTVLFNKLKSLADTNKDGKLIIAEMEAYKGDANGLLDLRNMNITNVKGLGYAKGVKSINLSGNTSITSIAENTFLDCTNLVSIVLPYTVASIGNSSFEGCSSLKEINLPGGLTAIGDKAFFECKGLTSIALPALISSIGNSAFSGSGLTSIEIPNPNLSIGISVFNGCRDLETVKLPVGMSKIPMETFKATGIQSISLPASIHTIEEGAFDSSSLLTIDLSGCTNLTSIKTSAFASTPLTNVKLPESLTELGARAFENCIFLPNIKIPSKIAVINELTFGNCYSLENVEFTTTGLVNGVSNYNLQEIKAKAFYGCSMLGGESGDVTFLKNLNKLTSIGDEVFAYTAGELQQPRLDSKGNYVRDGLGNIIYDKVRDEYGFQVYYGIKTITLPGSLVQMGKGAFLNAHALKTITIPDKVAALEDKSFSNCFNLEYIKLSNTLTSIGNNTFENCRSLDNLVFPQSLNRIGSNAFLNCAVEKVRTVAQGKEYTYTGIQELVLPDNVTEIGAAAFKGCFNLKTVKLPANLTQLSASVFEGCSIQLKGTDGKLIPNSYIGIESITLPAPLVSIGNMAFRNCKSLKGITMTYYLETIGSQAFMGCDSLVEANFRSAANLKTIGSSAFENSQQLNLVNFNYANNLSTLGVYAFRNTGISGLLRLPASLKRIETGVFEGCKNITSVEFPDGLTSIGNTSFKDCINLISITIPAAATIVHNGINSSFYRSNVFSNAIVKAVPSDISVMENAELALPLNCFNEITSVEVENENPATAEIRTGSTNPQIVVRGIKTGQTKITIKGVIQYETGKDPLSGNPLVNRFETQVQFNIIVSAIKCTGVRFEQPVRGLRLNNTTGIMLNPVITPVDTSDLRVWSSDNESVAKVGSDGKVTPVGYGSTTIRLKVGDQPEVQCQVNVCAPASSISLDKTDITLVTGHSSALKATVNYSSTFDAFKALYPEVLIWTSSNPQVASVDQNGNINALSYGETVITLRADAAGLTRTCKVTVVPEVTDVSFDKSNITLTKGQIGQITMKLNPSDSPISKIKVVSSNTTVASVSVTGNIITVTAKSGGTVTITATPVSGNAAICQVQVNSPLTSLTAAPMELSKGQSRTISITKTPTDATDTILYTSNNPNVATVDALGKVTGVGAGTAIITLKSENGLVTAQCSVTVVSPVTGVSLNTTSATIAKGSKLQLVATVSPADATNKSVTWSSSNMSVATVDENGMVTALSEGTATITVRTVDGNRSASCTLTVKTSIFKERDINKDGKVDILDVALAAKSYNSKTGSSLYSSNVDINSDSIIDMFDLVLISTAFTK